MSVFMGDTIGHIVRLQTTNPLHYTNNPPETLDDDVSTSFAQVLKRAVAKVNNLQNRSNELVQEMIYRPESVDIHTVMIAGQKAEIALNFTKAIRDEALRSYRELINLR